MLFVVILMIIVKCLIEVHLLSRGINTGDHFGTFSDKTDAKIVVGLMIIVVELMLIVVSLMLIVVGLMIIVVDLKLSVQQNEHHGHHHYE